MNISTLRKCADDLHAWCDQHEGVALGAPSATAGFNWQGLLQIVIQILSAITPFLPAKSPASPPAPPQS